MPIPKPFRVLPALAGAIAAVAAAALPTPALAAGCPGAAAPISRLGDAQVRVATVCELNARRRAAGLPRLHAVRSLTRLAQLHTGVMVARRSLDHGNLGRRLRRYTAGHAFMVGENIGTCGGGGGTVAQMVVAWMHSPEHRANILQPRFRDVGVGVVHRATDGSPGATMTTSFGWRG